MSDIEKILKNTNDSNQDKVDWTKAWSGKYPVLKQYQSEVDIPKYAAEIRRMFEQFMPGTYPKDMTLSLGYFKGMFIR